MVDVSQQHPPVRAARPPHPTLLQLAGGAELSLAKLRTRPDATQHTAFIQMLANAEYWLSFELAAFEPILAKSPSPLREVGVAVALRFGEGVGGELSLQETARARTELTAGLAPDLQAAVVSVLQVLDRAIQAREAIPAMEADGFRRYQPTQALSVHALRAMGRSRITISGVPDDQKRPEVPIGQPIVLKAMDDKGKPLSLPEIESSLESPVYARDDKDAGTRTIFLLAPGEYGVRVPGRAAGDRKLIAL